MATRAISFRRPLFANARPWTRYCTYQPRVVVHFAAESHVDRSIHGPGDFIQTNIVGTFTLSEATRAYWDALPDSARVDFRFLAHLYRRGIRLAGPE